MPGSVHPEDTGLALRLCREGSLGRAAAGFALLLGTCVSLQGHHSVWEARQRGYCERNNWRVMPSETVWCVWSPLLWDFSFLCTVRSQLPLLWGSWEGALAPAAPAVQPCCCLIRGLAPTSASQGSWLLLPALCPTANLTNPQVPYSLPVTGAEVWLRRGHTGG